ncbi:hypothetical protein GQ600_14767 [Phytophthora cactorum]|nr:hypothetical protein GQ600_14767 [Phytophthora cactorum]
MFVQGHSPDFELGCVRVLKGNGVRLTAARLVLSVLSSVQCKSRKSRGSSGEDSLVQRIENRLRIEARETWKWQPGKLADVGSGQDESTPKAAGPRRTKNRPRQRIKTPAGLRTISQELSPSHAAQLSYICNKCLQQSSRRKRSNEDQPCCSCRRRGAVPVTL